MKEGGDSANHITIKQRINYSLSFAVTFALDSCLSLFHSLNSIFYLTTTFHLALAYLDERSSVADI